MGLFDVFKKNNKLNNTESNKLNTEQINLIVKNWDEILDFKFNNPYDGTKISKINNVILPTEYIEFMCKHNGGEGDIGNTWFILYPLEKLEQINNEYKTNEYLPNSIIIGTNGNSELYGINENGEFFNVPDIMERKYVKTLGKNFHELPEKINNLWSK